MNKKRRLIIAGVWKINKTVAEARGLAIVEGATLPYGDCCAAGEPVCEASRGSSSGPIRSVLLLAPNINDSPKWEQVAPIGGGGVHTSAIARARELHRK